MSETFTRTVLGPNGMTEMTFKKEAPKTPSKSQEKPTVVPTETKPEPSTGQSTQANDSITAEITIELIRAMEPQELRVLAEENNLKIGNVKDKVKMQDKIIKLLKLEDESEAL